MKNRLLLLLLGLMLCIGITLHAQTTNAPSTNAPTVTQPTAVTPPVIYSPGKIAATPAQTAALQSAYLTPMLSSVGVTLPSGAVLGRAVILFYADGSSQMIIVPVAPAKLPAPPAGL